MPAPPSDLGRIPGQTFIPTCTALRLRWTGADGKAYSNVLHASYGSSPVITQDFVNNLFTAFKTSFTSSGLSALMHSSCSFDGIGLRDMKQDSTGFGMGEWVSTIAGTPGTSGDTDALPPQIAFVVSLKTGFSRQANRGRVYLGGFAAVANDGSGKATAAVATDTVAFISSLQSVLAGPTYNLELCIAHPARQGYTSPRTGVSYPARLAGHVPVTNIAARDLNWDTQRLRNLR